MKHPALSGHLLGADVIAETFTTAWRRLNDVPAGDGARLWLYGAARLRLHRAHKRLAKELNDLDIDLTTYGSRAVSLAEGRS
ncbi:hypothetical protein OHA25_12490 [Nonomuraea sp. NBC_00507]|uniref:hypothetical protein n=1 Tax=Nonomuraea sp. NBC_00507 TaxID=2976002 RepID=UPI002E182AFB